MNTKAKQDRATGVIPQTSSYVVSIYSLLAFLSLGVFGVLHIIDNAKPDIGYLELVGSLILLSNLGFLVLTKNVTFATYVFLLTVLAYLALMLISGGTQNTGIFWFFTFPVAAFFLTDKRAGLWWMVGLSAMTATVLLLVAGNALATPYNAVTIRQLLICMLVVSAGVYAYQRSCERLEGQALESRQRLHQEQVRADVVLQQIDEGIVVTDNDGRVSFANKATESLLGWQLRELKGKKFVDMVPMLDGAGGTVPPTSRPLMRSLLAGKSITAIATYKRKDGQSIPVLVTGMPVVTDGITTGGIATFRDISEEQRIAHAKSEFISLASHQLRTPISAIAWTAELLLADESETLHMEQRQHVQEIYRSNQRMANLVSEMLIVSSLELGTLPILPQETDIAALTAKIVKEQVAMYRKDSGTEVVSEQYDKDLTHMLYDPDIFTLLLRNILSNALKYTSKKGHITVKLSVEPKVKLKSGSNGSIALNITDTGYGIPKDDQDKIFTKFFRAINIQHRDTDGTGLGLYVVKEVLDYVGGRVSFSSEEGKGTTFMIFLPIEGMEKRESPVGDTGQFSVSDVVAAHSGGIHV